MRAACSSRRPSRSLSPTSTRRRPTSPCQRPVIAENAGANADGRHPHRPPIRTRATRSPTPWSPAPASTDNAAFNIVGNSLRADASFNFEADSSYTSASAPPTRAACSSRRPSRSPSPTSTRRRPTSPSTTSRSPRTSRRQRRRRHLLDDRPGCGRHLHLHPGRRHRLRPTTPPSTSSATSLRRQRLVQLRGQTAPTRSACAPPTPAASSSRRSSPSPSPTSTRRRPTSPCQQQQRWPRTSRRQRLVGTLHARPTPTPATPSPTRWSPAPARPTTPPSTIVGSQPADGGASFNFEAKTVPTSIRVRTHRPGRPVLREGLHDHRHQRQRDARRGRR